VSAITEEKAGSADPNAMKPDDWICQECGDHQFAKNLACRKCGVPKPKTSTNHIVAKKGDWICPGCQDVQFERNMMCRRCSTPRPGMMPGAMMMGGNKMGCMVPNMMGGMGNMGCMGGMGNMGGMGCRGGCGMTPMIGCGGMVASNKVVFKEGDWICPNPECQDVQFERNVICRKCGTAKPDGTGSRGRSRSPTRLAM